MSESNSALDTPESNLGLAAPSTASFVSESLSSQPSQNLDASSGNLLSEPMPSGSVNILNSSDTAESIPVESRPTTSTFEVNSIEVVKDAPVEAAASIINLDTQPNLVQESSILDFESFQLPKSKSGILKSASIVPITIPSVPLVEKTEVVVPPIDPVPETLPPIPTQEVPPEPKKKPIVKKVKIDENTKKKIAHWPTSRQNTPSVKPIKRGVGRSDAESSIGPNTEPDFDDAILRAGGQYEEIPHMMDGFRMLNRGPSNDPEHVYSLNLSAEELLYVIEDDLTLFGKLMTLNVSENTLPFARVGVLPSLKKLIMSCNSVKSLDLEVQGRFTQLEYLDLSFNSVDYSAIMVLGTLPKLTYLDLSSNEIGQIPKDLSRMERWRDKVIEFLLPTHVAAMDAHMFPEEHQHPPEPVEVLEVKPEPKKSFHNVFEKRMVRRVVDGVMVKVNVPPPTPPVREPSPRSKSLAKLPRVSEVRDDRASVQPESEMGEHAIIDRTAPSEMDPSVQDTPLPAQSPFEEGLNESYARPSSRDQKTRQSLMYEDSVLYSPDMKGFGYKSLDTLILENNRLGMSESTEFWFVLSQFPNLRVLNLNGNGIKSLRPLIPDYIEQGQDPIDLLAINPHVLVKYDGFGKLVELSLTRNKIQLFDDLIGVICLQRLNRMFLAGNPIMKKFVPEHLLSKRQQKQAHLDIDIFKLFSKSYGITISDPCFLATRSNLETELVAITSSKDGAAVTKFNRHAAKSVARAPFFIGHYLKKNVKVRIGHHLIPHFIQKVTLKPSDQVLSDQKKRRHYEFTDQDLEHIVKKGKIPPISELMHLALHREQFKTQLETLEGVQKITDELDDQGDLPESMTTSMQELFYDPNRMDDTFLTGVHITGGKKESDAEVTDDDEEEYDSDESGSEDEDGEEESDSESDEDEDKPKRRKGDEEDDEDMIAEADRVVYPLPTSIQPSVRALRHLLSNPVSYWRMMEESFARPTFASMQREENLLWTEDAMKDIRASSGDVLNSMMSLEPERPGTVMSKTSHASGGSSIMDTAQGTPANSIWTPAHGQQDGLFPLDRFALPQDFMHTKTDKRQASSIVYRTREELQANARMTDKELHRELNMKLRQNLNNTTARITSAKYEKDGKNVLEDVNRNATLQKKLTTAAALQRAHLEGRLRPKDEFEELNDLMTVVDKKINTIEANLAHIMGSDALKKHLPQSKQLFDELRKEYDRIENMYLADAKTVVQSEPLSQRLRKLGLTSS